ncbi:MAG TPA: heparin lyase I family protein [Polyangiaceae bacterium]|jgi:hypothetical protein
MARACVLLLFVAVACDGGPSDVPGGDAAAAADVTAPLADGSSAVDSGPEASGSPTPQAGDTIVFDDDFETGDFSKWKTAGHITYAEVAARYIVDATGNQSGHSARVTIGAGDPQYGINVAFLPGYDELYVQWDVKFSAGFVNDTNDCCSDHQVDISGNQTNDMWTSDGTAGIRPSGTDFFITGVDPESPGTAGSRSILDPMFYTYWPDMPCPSNYSSSNHDCYGGVLFQTAPKVDLDDAQWHRVVFHGKANTVTPSVVADGLQEVWIDGKKVLSQTGMRWRTASTLAWNRVKFEDYFNDPPTTTEYTWYDNVLIWSPN